ncbi:hypothetical protein [Deinococcus enclensis]|uniref:DUF1990 domain-containing protein n=1 Tax=Deinococcus enclensis TaxID=1049582 RepID=A0ABT9MIU6_9DEIO|nr:hypothetical protein [Deinococcus enclensis]MDP9766522.1 hypothetical protein [Deinococcus enclensis]
MIVPGDGCAQNPGTEAAIMDGMKRATTLLITALTLSVLNAVSAQGAGQVPAPGSWPDQAARALLAAPLKPTGFTLPDPGDRPLKVRVQLPKGLEASRNANGSVGREAWIRSGDHGPDLGIQLKLGLWSNAGMTMVIGGSSVTKRDGAFTVRTTTYRNGDIGLEVTRPAGKAFDGVLVCSATVNGWGVSPALLAKTSALALKICKSFELDPR